MEAEELIAITKYISVWNWQILSIIFLCFSLVFFAMPKLLVTTVFCLSFLGLFIVCEIMSLKRKMEIYEK